jgi:2-keto-4-pentenoate hydratase/2-oxohepta-3-ene-1,7-dioic acid hydratase in catechol pathway
MKLATFRHKGKEAIGILDPAAQRIHNVAAIAGTPIDTMSELIEACGGSPDNIRPEGDDIPLAEVTLLAPIPRPRRNVFCVGKNYREHAREFTGSGFDSSAASVADAIPDVPIVFTKVPESVIADGDPIILPAGVSEALDYEAELTVIIGKGGRGISRADALSHVFGYTIVNDVTARDWQGRHKQWFLGKSFDTFCPMGPVIVTAGALDVGNLRVRTWVNDELRQDANTADLIFDVPTLIETISAGITLYPGDVIATGTPKGVGIGFKPPRYLRAGDEVRIEIDGIGTLTNRVALAT